MYEPDHFKRLLDRVRLRTIVGPEQLEDEGASPEEPPPLDGHAIAVPAPAWLVRAFTAR